MCRLIHQHHEACVFVDGEVALPAWTLRLYLETDRSIVATLTQGDDVTITRLDQDAIDAIVDAAQR